MPTLHILNGDSTLNIFKTTGIEGDTFVWRDVLVEGPISGPIGTLEFWNDRETFMSKYFSLQEGEYAKAIKTPFQEMEKNLSTYDEIILWFEYDLFCQINMLALIDWLAHKRKINISLVCTGKVDGSDRLYGLGEIHSSEYKNLYENRIKLEGSAFDFASNVYRAYCSSNPNTLLRPDQSSSTEFPYLSSALESHSKRFPNTRTGLTETEEQLIQFINEGETDKMKLIGKMLRWQTYQGFGDLQYSITLNGLKPLFDDFDNLVLKPQIDKQTVESLVNRNYFFGGQKMSDWYWDENKKALVPKV